MRPFKVTLQPGQIVRVEFEESDGAFEVHFDSDEHPKAIVVKETAGLGGSVLGRPLQLLYVEEFGEEITDEDLIND